jgi:hypothetical protein
MARLLREPYLTASQALLDGAFSQAAMNARIDELAALIADEVAADDKSTQSLVEWQSAVNELKDVVAAKRSHILSKFP